MKITSQKEADEAVEALSEYLKGLRQIERDKLIRLEINVSNVTRGYCYKLLYAADVDGGSGCRLCGM